MLPSCPDHQPVGSIWPENLKKNQRKGNCAGKEIHFVANFAIL
jgi:hypothetical protein